MIATPIKSETVTLQLPWDLNLKVNPVQFAAIAAVNADLKLERTATGKLIVLPKGQDIVDVKTGKKGPVSDIKIFREQQKKFDPNQKFKGDKAYVGGFQMSTPHKKPKNQKLSLEQKEENKIFSANRNFVEHLIGKPKNFRISAEIFRLKRSNYESVISTVCGLVRLRIRALILPN